MRATRKTAQPDMEKPCITTYVIIGNKCDTKILYGCLQKLAKTKKRILPYEATNTTLRTVASQFCPQWSGYDVEGHFYDLQQTNDRQFTFKVETMSTPNPQIWFQVIRKYLTVKCYYYAQIPGTGYSTTNDATGLYFPQRYMVIDNNGTSKAVVSQRQLYDEVAGRTNLPEPFTTLEALGKSICKFIGHIKVYDILVVDSRGKCISQNNQLISQFIK